MPKRQIFALALEMIRTPLAAHRLDLLNRHARVAPRRGGLADARAAAAHGRENGRAEYGVLRNLHGEDVLRVAVAEGNGDRASVSRVLARGPPQRYRK